MEYSIHEDCGVALVRLLKPLSYYQKKYGTWRYGLGKLYLMMEKQHNRGQEGAGIASVKLNPQPGNEYMFRERAEGPNAITEIFGTANCQINQVVKENSVFDESCLQEIPFAGELYMGHLRYSTTGKSGLKYVHPFLRRNNWRAKNLCLCGNYNMTNVEEVFEELTRQGQCPRIYSDSYIMLELMGHRLDREVERNFREAKKLGLVDQDITHYIDGHVKMENVLKTTMKHFDGGYVVTGLTGSGEMFAMRDPHGIRPAFYYKNDEVVVLASERPVLQTTFDIEYDDVKELKPGMALIVRSSGETVVEKILAPLNNAACSFERIYFSRGSDQDIYRERKKLGEQLMPAILKSINGDIRHSVFSFIPNTAEAAFYGLIDGFKKYVINQKIDRIEQLGHTPTHDELLQILNEYVRCEKVASNFELSSPREVPVMTLRHMYTILPTDPLYRISIISSLSTTALFAVPHLRKAFSISSTVFILTRSSWSARRRRSATPTTMASTCHVWRNSVSSVLLLPCSRDVVWKTCLRRSITSALLNWQSPVKRCRMLCVTSMHRSQSTRSTIRSWRCFVPRA